MNAAAVVSAMTKGRVICLSGDGYNRIRVLGSTVALSTYEETNMVYLTVPDDHLGVIAINVKVEKFDHKDRATSYTKGFFLSVSNKGGEAYIEIKKSWMPPAGILPSIQHISGGWYGIRVEIEDQVFMSRPRVPFMPEKSVRYVNGDVLCRYFAGEIKAEDVGMAATEIEAELSAREQLPLLQRQVEELTAALKRWNEAYEKKDGESLDAWGLYRTTCQMLERRQQFCQKQGEIIKQLRAVIIRLSTLVERVFWSKKGIRNNVAVALDRLKEFSKLETSFFIANQDGGMSEEEVLSKIR
jgi:hypothetical protein